MEDILEYSKWYLISTNSYFNNFLEINFRCYDVTIIPDVYA
jgi:hypothetical protein